MSRPSTEKLSQAVGYLDDIIALQAADERQNNFTWAHGKLAALKHLRHLLMSVDE